jgi:hypothetical protein
MTRLTICVAAAAACGVALASDIPPPRPVDVTALVEQLGSDDFAEREAATKRLSMLPVDAPPPELVEALRSPNPEVRDRAERALKALREHIVLSRERAALARLPRGERFAKRGQIDLYVASTAASEWKADDDRLWVPAFEIGRTAIAKAGLKGDYRPNSGPMGAGVKDFAAFRKLIHNNFVRTDGVFVRGKKEHYVFRGAVLSAGVSEAQWLEGLIVSRGPVNVQKGITNALILATGDVDCGENLHDAVVICDGDVRVRGTTRSCFIVTRGKITVGKYAHESTFVTRETVLIEQPRKHIPKGLENVIQEKVVRPLDYITFFELSTVGVEAKAADGAVRVTAVAEGKPFADAGVRAGDVVASVNGKAPDSPESLRRLLRDALAVGDATITLSRGDKTETVKVSLPE